MPRGRRTSFLLIAGLCFAVILTFYYAQQWRSDASEQPGHDMLDSPEIRLRTDLEDVVLAKFDALVKSREIFFEESVPEQIIHRGFQFEFRVVSFLDKKPIAAPNSPDRLKPGGPFENPRPEEVITSVGNAHRLMLNKYCVYRPMLVMPTAKYAPQTDDLDESDIAAAWNVLKAFKTPQMVIYNCGANAGSSIGHKHLQIFPLPSASHQTLFPARATSSKTVEDKIVHVPFKHFVLRIPEAASATGVYKQYTILLNETRKALTMSNAGQDYNVVFTAKWIALIPRRTAVWGGPFGANAAGMVGMVTVPSQEQKNQWAELGYSDYLTKLGIPID